MHRCESPSRRIARQPLRQLGSDTASSFAQCPLTLFMSIIHHGAASGGPTIAMGLFEVWADFPELFVQTSAPSSKGNAARTNTEQPLRGMPQIYLEALLSLLVFFGMQAHSIHRNSLLPASIKVDAHLETDGKLHPSHRTHCISEAGAVLALLMALVECFCRSLSTYPGRTSHGIGRWIFVAMSCRDIRTQSRKFSDDDRLLLHRVATYDGRTGYMLH